MEEFVTARWSNRCARCNRRFVVGVTVITRRKGSYGWVHYDSKSCRPKAKIRRRKG
jgi:hypothetical protein